jgi:5'-deoxynucleotidase YfbR-like HD superfamily hydrolase
MIDEPAQTMGNCLEGLYSEDEINEILRRTECVWGDIDNIQAENAALRSALEKAAIESATAPSGYALGYKDGWEDRKYNDILEAEIAALREALRELVEAEQGFRDAPNELYDEAAIRFNCALTKAQARLEAKP